MSDLYPNLDSIISRAKKERKLQQRAKVFWFTGLSGSGKTSIATHFEEKLFSAGFLTQVLDGDNIRAGINQDLGFSLEDRNENIRRIAEIATLFLNHGTITIVAFISPTIALRDLAKNIIGQENFIEVYINSPLEVCEARDVKGLYKKARAGEILDFSGISSPYEAPKQPALTLNTKLSSVSQCVDVLYDFALPLITYS